MTQLERESKTVQRVVDTIGSSFVGKRNVIRKMVAAALANGHVLFEDYPGLGKTLLVKVFARCLSVRFNRVQFTPDILPSDILGTKIWDQKTANFKLSRGPIFTQILLADEINRAPPKTQSGLLEAMEERQVTIEGETLALPEPFFVLATQNPIEQEGSLALEESVLVDGRLRTGRELLAHSKGVLAGRPEGIQLHQLDARTVSLTPDGRLQETPCLLYTLPYRDDFLVLTTRTGRRLRVTKNHPLLVNEGGRMVWKRAEELAKGDYLVQPARLPPLAPWNPPGHDEALRAMKQRPVPREIPFDRDFAFWIAFVLADGSLGGKAVEAVQRNFPQALERWVDIARRYGFRPSVRVRGGVRHARIYSKPLIEYLRVRFGVLEGRDKEIPTHVLSWPPEQRREFLKTFLALESGLRDRRITFTQKSERNVNVIAHLLIAEGILPWVRHDGRIWRLCIQGKDVSEYLQRVGWLDERKARRDALSRRTRSSFRSLPVPVEYVRRVVHLLGLDRFGRVPSRPPITRRSWYGGYRGLLDGEHVMSEDSLRSFVQDMRAEIDRRSVPGFLGEAATDTKALAQAVGLSMTELAEELSISKNQVWGLYQGRRTASATLVHGHLVRRATQRLDEARALLRYLDGLLTADLMFDPVRTIERTPSDGMAFGLTVPGPQNYLAGLGAFGINHNTYPLPEAQLDRFLIKLSTGYPESEQLEAEILMRRITWKKDDPTADIRPILTGDAFRQLQQVCERDVFVHPDLLLYISKVVRGLRAHPKVEVGPSPRGSLALLKISRAAALMAGRDYVTPDDVKLFVADALAHRTILSVEHVLDGLTPHDVVREVVSTVPVPTRFLETQTT